MSDKKRNYNGKTAIIVDDDIDLLEQMALRLRGVGFTVHEGESQAEGEKLLEEQNYDIAIFDLMMENPDSGFILSHKAKAKNPGKPVILATAVTSETGLHFDADMASKSWVKADAVLDKGLRFEQLEKEISKLL